MATTRLLSAEDIYDLYGLEAVLKSPLYHGEESGFISSRLQEIRDIYIAACKSRIRAEAVFVGIKLDDNFSFDYVLKQVKQLIGKELAGNATRTMGGGPVNLMATILNAHKAAGSDLKGIDLERYGVKDEVIEKPKGADVDPEWFMKSGKFGDRIWDNPRWAEIAKAYLAIESARSDQEIIQSIDRINLLQHNSFHVLIDLQTGRMLRDYSNQSDDRDARKRLQEVLDLKQKSGDVRAFADQMSGDVRKLLNSYYR